MRPGLGEKTRNGLFLLSHFQTNHLWLINKKVFFLSLGESLPLANIFKSSLSVQNVKGT